MRQLLIVLIVLVVTACTAPPAYRGGSTDYPTKYPTDQRGSGGERHDRGSQGGSSDSQDAGGAAIRPGDGEVAHGAAAATSGLLQDAWALYRGEEYQRAIVMAERAMRIDRRNAEVYLLLASAHYQQYHTEQAAQLARQGLNYSISGDRVDRRLKELLARIKRGSE